MPFISCSGPQRKAAVCRTNLSFLPVSDDGVFDEDVLQARVEREAKSNKQFALDMQAVHSIASFSEWLHLKHLCYAVLRQPELGHSTHVPDRVLASY
jgi:hypothetical protein